MVPKHSPWFQKTRQGGSTRKEFIGASGQVRSRKTPVCKVTVTPPSSPIFNAVSRKKKSPWWDGRGDIRAGNEPKQMSWSYFLTQHPGRVFCQNPLALPIEATEVVKKRLDQDPRHNFHILFQCKAAGGSPAEPPAWQLLSEPSALHTQLLWRTRDPAGLRRSHAGVTALSCLGGHFAPQIILGHPVCFQGLLKTPQTCILKISEEEVAVLLVASLSNLHREGHPALPDIRAMGMTHQSHCSHQLWQ